jgi:hypothetical protein
MLNNLTLDQIESTAHAESHLKGFPNYKRCKKSRALHSRKAERSMGSSLKRYVAIVNGKLRLSVMKLIPVQQTIAQREAPR